MRLVRLNLSVLQLELAIQPILELTRSLSDNIIGVLKRAVDTRENVYHLPGFFWLFKELTRLQVDGCHF
jgi:hypothetical protein